MRLWKTRTRTCLNVSDDYVEINIGRTRYTVGRTKLACELLGQYLPQDIQQALLDSYEYVPGTISTDDAKRPN